ncbi:MAG: methyltransferase domain-containing protein [Angelakisella sp.]|jgi:SAM-dependent methyltransferase|nr:methyltransferase domain-containing protein [Angelakisella sp.]
MEGDRCYLALEAIRQTVGGNMTLWKGRPELLWLRYLWATREKDYNRARYSRLDQAEVRETLAYTRHTLEALVAAPGDWTPEERDIAALVLSWAEAAKGGMPREREAWQRAGISLVDHANGSAELYFQSLAGPPGPEEAAVSLLIRMHGAVGQYLQGEISPESGTLPFTAPGELSQLEALCQGAGFPFSRFCRVLALVSRCVLAGVSPSLAEQHREVCRTIARGGLLPPLSPGERALRLCGGKGAVLLSSRAEELLQGRDLWYADGVLRAMGPVRGGAFLDVLAASLPREEPVRACSRAPGMPAASEWALRERTVAALSLWRPGRMLSLKSLQDRLYFYSSAGERRTDHCILAMAERAGETGVFRPTSHLDFSFSRSGEGAELALETALTPTGEAIDRFYQTLVEADITHNRAILAVFDLLGYRPDIFARVGNEDQYLESMNRAADDKRRLLAFLRDGDRVLDVGPGGGVLLDLVAGEYPHCTLAGVDVSAEVCQRLSQRVQAEGLPWQVIHRDFLALRPEEAGQFDAILFCSIIHEIFSYGEYQGRRFNKAVIPRIIENAVGLLRPGGRIIIRDGVASAENPMVRLRFLDPQLEELARDYLRQFRGFPLQAQLPGELGEEHRYRMPQNSAMELLYTITWGKEALPFEVEEWYGYYTLADWRALGEGLPGVRLVYSTQYLQPGYPEHLAGRVELSGDTGEPVPFPDSNLIVVFEKEET